MAAITDYIVKSGDTTSELAKEFYARFGGDTMENVVLPEYGVSPEFTKTLNSLYASTDDSIKEFINAMGIQNETADSLPVNMKVAVSSAIQQLQDATESRLLPAIQAQAKYSSTAANPLEGDYSRVISGVDFSGLSDDVSKQLSDVLGISFKNISDGFGSVSIDSSEIMDNITGWITKLPDSIKLDGSTLSAQDVSILASAGIQVNGDGTVTFMKAMNENTTGTERTTTLTIADVSNSVISKLNESGLSFDFSGSEAALDLSLSAVSKKMTGAMFLLNKDLSGQISDDMKNALSGLGTVFDSGYINITNEAVLSGKMTITEYLKSIGKTVDDLSPELRTSLEAIDAIIAQGGEVTKETVANWADGVVMPSPIDASALTDEMKTAFAAIGITFEDQAGQFMMVVNKVGDQLQDGMVLVPTETWNKLDSDITEALQALGVSITPTAAGVMVDVSTAMESGVGSIIELFANRPDLWDQIPQTIVDQLAAAGFAVDNGMLAINTAMLNSLVNLDGQWYGTWSSLSTQTLAALGKLSLATSDGMMTIEQITADTKIPDNVNEYIKKPFEELPQEIQDKLTGGDSSVAASLKSSSFLITSATNDAFVGAIQAVKDNFNTMSSDASSGASDIATAVAKAMASVQQMNQITVGKTGTWGAGWGGTKNTLGDPITRASTGYTYYPEYDANGKFVTWKYIDKKGAQQSTGSIPSYATGGIIDSDGTYRAGEFGKKEGIIPLENRNSLSAIGYAIGKTMSTISSPVQRAQIQAARGLSNGGVQLPTAADTVNSYMNAAANIQQAGTQVSSGTDSRPIVYVQTMIADKQGLRELESKLQVIRLDK